MGEASLNAQPKNGMDNNSFLATNASGGKMKFSASVSQVEECFDITICGLSRGGICSAPMIRWRMPQIHRAANRFSQHQPMMNLKRGTGGAQNDIRTNTA